MAQVRDAELAVVQHMEAVEKRKAEERERRVAQARRHAAEEAALKARMAAAAAAGGLVRGVSLWYCYYHYHYLYHYVHAIIVFIVLIIIVITLFIMATELQDLPCWWLARQAWMLPLEVLCAGCNPLPLLILILNVPHNRSSPDLPHLWNKFSVWYTV
jgi:hypothetical protein